VWPVGEAARRPFRIDGQRAYGPGVLDDKCGVVAGLSALRVLRELDFKDFAQITLLLNSNEETGSIGTRQLMQNLARKHDVALNLEAGRPGDNLILARKGSGVVELTVKGKAAARRRCPESGRNAAMEAAHQMLQLSRLGDPPPARRSTSRFSNPATAPTSSPTKPSRAPMSAPLAMRSLTDWRNALWPPRATNSSRTAKSR